MDPNKRAEELVFQGVCHARKGKHLKAVESFSEALELIPENPVVCYNLALEYLAVKEPELALSYLETALKSEPENPDYWCEKGIALYESQDYKGAEESYDLAIRFGGESSRLWNCYGVLRFISGQYRDAEEFFNRAVQLEPANRDAWFNLADTLDELGNRKGSQQARREYKRLSFGEES
jgi:tetratricopeptide (TPR) repeat protein